jgi:putative ABC transport system substrate-binding protein
MSGIRKILFIAKFGFTPLERNLFLGSAPLKRGLLTGFIFFWIFSDGLCFAVPPELAKPIKRAAVIFSSNIEPYQQSLKGFEEFFREQKESLHVYKYNLEKESAGAVYLQIEKEKSDIVLALGTKALRLAKEKLKNMPVVFSMVLNPEAITDLNISGVSLDIPPEIKLKNLKSIFPDAKKIGLIYSPQSELLYNDISRACTDLGFQLVSKKINSKKEFPDVLKDISWQIDWFMMTPDTDIYFPKLVEHLLRASLENKFPVIGLSSTYVRAGALISFDCDYEDLGRQAAELAMERLGEEKQVNTQLVRPRKVKISLNLLTAEILGIKIPPENIEQASQVFGK